MHFVVKENQEEKLIGKVKNSPKSLLDISNK